MPLFALDVILDKVVVCTSAYPAITINFTCCTSLTLLQVKVCVEMHITSAMGQSKVAPVAKRSYLCKETAGHGVHPLRSWSQKPFPFKDN